MSDERRSTLMEVYRAFNARDIDAALNHLAPGVDWQANTDGAHVQGRADVRQHWQDQWREADPRMEPTQIDFDADGRAHVRVHELVRARDGTVLTDRKVEHVFVFEGPFIGKLTIVDADPDPEADEDDEAEGIS